jgi:phosphoglucomutase
MTTISKFNLESKIHFSNAWWAFNADGNICDLDAAEYIDIVYDTCTDEYKKVAENEYQLISPN